MSALAFIDTNILLDFYRYPRGSAILPVLDHIDKNHSKIITSTQVEMEYKKNRQKVIVNSMTEMKGPKWDSFKLPVILSGSQAAQSIENDRKDIDKQSKILRNKIESILRNPSRNDDVFKTLQRLFKSSSELNLKRPDPRRFTIRNLAKKRFILGYPPRKDSDVTIGDAINWEWLIYCAKEKNQDVVIVSRDTDYGCKFGDDMIINDWLAQEFKQRVNIRNKVILTDKLMHGFKLANISVKKKEIEDETKMLSELKNIQQTSLLKLEKALEQEIDRLTKEKLSK
jgi:predicted nucleic acid-binding protein